MLSGIAILSLVGITIGWGLAIAIAVYRQERYQKRLEEEIGRRRIQLLLRGRQMRQPLARRAWVGHEPSFIALMRQRRELTQTPEDLGGFTEVSLTEHDSGGNSVRVVHTLQLN